MDQLGVFAKFWQPGRVKTRLAASIGDRPAASLYRLMLETMVARLARSSGLRTIAYTPRESQSEFRQLASADWQLAVQSEGDLGARLAAFFHHAFDAGADRVVVLGADSPNLPLERIHEAWQSLLDNEVVLGPTLDGGYYLVGARDGVPPIFEGVDWGTESVWTQTIARLKEHGTRYSCLPAWYDVDDLDDLVRLDADLRDLAHRAPLEPALCRLRDAVHAALAAVVKNEG